MSVLGSGRPEGDKSTNDPAAQPLLQFSGDFCVNNETESGAGTSRMALRPEARPAIYEVLDRQQKDAFGRIVKLIAEAIADIDAASGSRSAEAVGPSTQLPPWLDQRSATRMAFLHGHRGMGKTTLMLSVHRACFHWDDTEYPTDLADLVAAVRKMRARTVWLEPIAMEPLLRQPACGLIGPN